MLRFLVNRTSLLCFSIGLTSCAPIHQSPEMKQKAFKAKLDAGRSGQFAATRKGDKSDGGLQLVQSDAIVRMQMDAIQKYPVKIHYDTELTPAVERSALVSEAESLTKECPNYRAFHYL